MSALLSATAPRTFDDARRWVAEGTSLFFDRIGSLSPSDWSDASSLPGWTRSHLVGHVCANAEALGNLISWAATGVEKRMYASVEQRNADIERASGLPADELTAWFSRSADALDAAMDELTEEQWRHEIITAQGITRPASDVPWMRAREVLVHAVDLAAGTTFADLPEDFLVALGQEIRTKRGLSDEELAAVSGPLPDVVAWLAGRPHSLIDAPELGPWL
ncbi:maleylpyruvate isomerase family mycothiol-dependent enzyme [Nocardioides sp. KC13]|uniref:Maleylpyruvate isomerase family mycothiol-dependent enzyme n=1 Tax=Nocardioides turkmenicus TaxID=2711220 RepID=A0A6M1QWG7_9ACTN|nr:maleylpyruvate isomerase family mycothiol-dependent enzyme [Nocardioides sp. KC13]NGN91782.1 maleylpyruvate isomerase family mycothiol-dependent enzyme [Nocardioides sp. KC13]